MHVRQTKSDDGLQSETQCFRMSLGLVFGVFSRRWRVRLKRPFGKGVPTMARHLTVEDRDRIAELKHRGARQHAIARALIRSPPTICRQLKRNGSSRNTLWLFTISSSISTHCRSFLRRLISSCRTAVELSSSHGPDSSAGFSCQTLGATPTAAALNE